MTKRLFALLLSVVMVLSLLPVGVFAEGAESTAQQHTKYEAQSAHTDGAHICEHCIAEGKTEAEATITWTPWGDDASETNLPNTAGHYYLTKDMSVKTAEITSGHVVLCLNGKTVTASGTAGNANDRFYTLKNAGSVTILDCTAHVEEVEGQQVYKAGVMTGGTASGFMHNNSTSSTGSINIYDGIITGNSRSSSGAAICVQGKGKLNIYGGEFSNNSTNNGGGVIYIGSSQATHMEDAVFKGNSAGTNGGVITTNGTLVVKNAVLTGNTAKKGGAINSSKAVTLDGATITDNTTTTDHGAVTTTADVTVKGETVITGNKLGETGISNLYLQNNSKVACDGLTGAAKISLTLAADKEDAISTALGGADVAGFFAFDDNNYVAKVEGDVLVKAEAPKSHENSVHTCEHCDASATWTAWGDDETETNLPTADGHYYLTRDMEVTAVNLTSGHVILCLNGKTVTAKGTEGNAADRFYNLRSSGSLTIVDCTAHGEGNSYKAGKFTGSSNTAFWMSNNSGEKATGTITVYDGIFEKNVGKATGAVFVIQGTSAKLYVYGGRFAENEAINTASSKKGAGVAYGGASANTIHLENAVFYKNRADYGGVVYHAAGASASVPTQTTVINCVFDSNESVQTTGGALCFGGNAGVVIENTTFNGNVATTAGAAIRITGAASVLSVKDSTFTGNQGKGGAAAISAGGKVTLDGVSIIGNTSAAGEGAVHFLNASKVLTIKGNTNITENVNGNVVLSGSKIAVADLAATAKISVAGVKGDVLTDALTDAESVRGNFVADNTDLTVGVEDSKLVLTEGTEEPPVVPEGHTHCICGDSTCTQTTGIHKQVTFTEWGNEDAEKTKLPTSGNYCLVSDVTLTSECAVAGTLTLCLNGHTITVNKADTRAIALSSGDVLNLTDCQTTGTITGGNRTYGGAVSVHRGSVCNFYAGKITGNSAKTEEGGAFYVAAGNNDVKTGAVLNMYGGEISGNTARLGAAVRLTSPSGAGTKAQFNMYGGKITGNSTTGTNSTQYGAVVADNAVVQLLGGEISGNTSANRGAVSVTVNTQLTLGGDIKIQNNTVGGEAANLYLVGDAKFTVEGLTSAAKIGLTREAGRTTAVVSTNTVDAAVLTCFEDDQKTYIVKQDNGYLALAENLPTSDHMHKLCNDTACADHTDEAFNKWEKTDSLPTSGTYYLTADVTLTKDVAVAGKLTLCLNGFTVKVDAENMRAFSLTSSDVLTITDCKDTGAVTGGSRTYGGAISVHRGSTFNLYGGKITGNTALGEEGGALYVVSGNDDTKTGAVVNMYGGEISNNYARQGGAVRITAPSGAGTKAVFNMYGGKITGNEAKTNGSAIYAGTCDLNLYGGEISGNIAGADATVYVAAGTITTIEDVTITGNTAGNGAGLYVAAGDKNLTISGNAQILGNTAGGKQNNLFLAGEAKINLDQLDSTAKIGLSVEKGNRVVSYENDTDYTANFISDSAYKTLSYKDKALYISASADHNHCVCAAAATVCDHTAQVWQAWESSAALPTGEGYFYLTEDVVLSTQASFSHKTFICLNGHSVKLKEGATNARILKLQTGAELNLTDCQGTGVLSSGNAEFGGAVNVSRGSTFNMYGGIFSGNTSLHETNGQGAAIYAQASKDGEPGGVFNMYGGEISGNEAVLGAAVYGAASSTIHIYGGTIRNNKATKYGGGLYVTGSVATTIGAAKFEGNFATSSGGAVYITGAGSKVTVDGATFTDNTIDGYAGGAILAQSNDTEILISNSKFTGSKADAGGAIFASTNTKLTVDSSVFSGNTAKQGAAIYTLRCTAKIGKVEISGNTSTSKAAGIYVAAGEMTIDGATIKNNKGGSGTAICTASTSATIDGKSTTLYPTVHFLSGTVSGNTTTGSGAILLQGKTVFNMRGGSITGNKAKYSGGIYASTNSTFNMYGGTISNNNTEQSGGGIYALRSTVNLYGGTISGNSAVKMGGGIFLSGAKLYISNARIINNKTDSGTGGGGIATGTATVSGVKYASTIKMVSGEISGNYGRHGGAVLLQGTSETVLTIEGGLIANNTSKVEGGAFYISTHTTINVTGGTFTGNYTDGRGGVAYHNNSKGNYTGGEYYANKTKSSGGAFLVNGATCKILIKDITLRDHVAGGSGGAICHQGKGYMTLENVTIINNTSGGSAGGFYLANNTHLDAKNVIIKDNTAKSYGGGMYLGNNTYLTADGMTIENNTCGTEGGGIYSRSIHTILNNTKIIGNTSEGNGGGICSYAPALQGVGTGLGDFRTGHVFTNVDISNNITKNGQGGGIYVHRGSAFALKDVVMSGNESRLEGSAIWSHGDLSLDGAQISGNKSTAGYAVYLEDSRFDGHSYFTGVNKIGGNTIITDNVGGDMYMGEKTTVAVLESGIGENTKINVTIHSGLLTNVFYGEYNYEGGNLIYVVTAGNRSVMEPEYAEPAQETTPEDETETNSDPAEAGEDNTMLYVAIGGIAAVIVLAAVVMVVAKKKKSARAEKN